MAISDLYMSIGLKRNISHFANIVKIAKSDKNISQEEVQFLIKIAKKYNIDDEKFKEILKDPEKIPTLAHLDCEERIERFFELLKMVNADHIIANEEVSILRKIVTGLAFPLHQVDEIVDQAVLIEMDNCELEEFKERVLKVIKI